MDYQQSVETISWFRDRYLEGSLVIKPPYQRKPIWSSKQKCYLVESILLEFPVPEIYIQQATNSQGKTTYAVVDGQQRVRTVLQFVGSETDPAEQGSNDFVLDKLKPESAWRNMGFADLLDDTKVRFYGYRFAVRYLNTGNDDQVREVFERSNRYLSPLKPQELRNASYSGPFMRLSVTLADNAYWAENSIVTPASIRRMMDVEFISELLIGVLHGPQGGSAKVIDVYYTLYEDYEDEFPEQRRIEKEFAKVHRLIEKLYPRLKATRWSNKTDFYTLFVALSSLLRSGSPPAKRIPKLRKTLDQFAQDVDTRLANQKAKTSKNVANYVRAVEKGANDKPRRAVRHAALLAVISPYFGQ